MGNGSVITNQLGATTNWYEYMPFGEMLMEQSSGDYNNVYKYNGKEMDIQTGLYYYGARYYDPQRSFWLSVDPLVEKTISPYSYINNNPVNFIDPTGMIGEDPKKPNPDSLWHILTWRGARRNAQRSANAKADIGYESQVYENAGLWSVRGEKTRDDGNITTTSYFSESFNNQEKVYSKSWSVTTQSPEPVPIDYSSSLGTATIESPSPFRGKSNFDIVMVDTNPIMPAIAGAIAPPLGFLTGSVQTINDFSEGNYFGGTIGLLTLGASAKMSGGSYQWLRKGESYSHAMDMETVAYRWGASPKYLHKIPHPMMGKFNQYLRRQKLPFGDDLQRADPGHYHLEPNFKLKQ